MSGAISMRARLVEAFRGPWLPLEEDFHDPGVALDFVTSLEPSLGPTVVVVRSRLLRSGHAGVAGEWLCEAGSAALKAPNDLSHLWEYDLPSISRYRSGSAQIDLWESASPAAMLWAAGSIDGLRRASLDAAVACANLTLPLIRSYGRARAREAETAIDAEAAKTDAIDQRSLALTRPPSADRRAARSHWGRPVRRPCPRPGALARLDAANSR